MSEMFFLFDILLLFPPHLLLDRRSLEVLTSIQSPAEPVVQQSKLTWILPFSIVFQPR